MKVRLALQLALLFATALIIPACGSKGPPGAPGPSASDGISYSNSTSGMAATTVQEAIDEFDFRLDLLEQVPADTVHLSAPSAQVSYTVPAGKSLVITFFRTNSASPYTVEGVKAGYSMVNLGRLVANEGETVICPSPSGETPILHGYLISKDRAPGMGIHGGGTPYTVPAGKTLYITQLFTPVVAVEGDITIDGVLLASAGTIPTGENVFIPVKAGRVVNAAGTSTFHGYLK